MTRVLIIIPCYNEAQNLLSVVRAVNRITVAAPAHIHLDYLVINDASTDHSLQIIKKHHFPFINLPTHSGLDVVMQTGFEYALHHHYDIALQFDCDGQHPADYILALIQPVLDHQADLAIGSRFVDHTNPGFKSSTPRRIGIHLISALIKLFSGQTIKDPTSGFRAFNQEILQVLVKNRSFTYPSPVVALLCAQSHYKIQEVSVVMQPRQHGKSYITPVESAHFMLRVLWLFLKITIQKNPLVNVII